MCIRDRFEEITGITEEEFRTLRDGQDVTEDDGSVTQIPGPVSYTHLRAHETVLDLVCRLLLEKQHILPYKRIEYVVLNYLNIIMPGWMTYR